MAAPNRFARSWLGTTSRMIFSSAIFPEAARTALCRKVSGPVERDHGEPVPREASLLSSSERPLHMVACSGTPEAEEAPSGQRRGPPARCVL